MGFLQEYAALDVPGKTPEQVGLAQLALLQEWVVQRSHELFTELRAGKPIFVTPGPVIVSLYKDVMEVVQLDDVFGVEPYGHAMMQVNGGPNFILGMDSSPELQHDQSVLRLAIRRNDMGIIRICVADATLTALQAALPARRLDLTANFARLIPAQLVDCYFGVPGPDVSTLLKWTRAMFQAIFLNFGQDPQVAATGEQAGVEFRQYVDELIAARHKQQATGALSPDTVLDRLIEMQAAPEASFTDEEIRNNLIGCITGVIDNTNTAVIGALDVLLSNPEHLAGAVAAAQADDKNLLRQYILEALRFRPPAPLLVRFSLQEHVLARHTERETTIPANKVVFASNSSAMMDETMLDAPHEWKLDRPEHEHLHFGWGLHQCMGKYIAETQLVEIMKGVLSLKNLRRASGSDGEVKFDGPFISGFVVEFDAS